MSHRLALRREDRSKTVNGNHLETCADRFVPVM